MIPLLYKDDKIVIRAETKNDGTVHLYLHRIQDGVEQIPRGYWLGSNSLINRPAPQPKSHPST